MTMKPGKDTITVLTMKPGKDTIRYNSGLTYVPTNFTRSPGMLTEDALVI
jgi:hypothetical protein